MKRVLAASFRLMAEAIAEVFRNRIVLLRGTLLPIAGILLVDAFASTANTPWGRLALSLAVFPLYALLATTVHRVILLGEHSLPSPSGVYWTERETRFTGWLIGIAILFFALSLPVGLITAVFEGRGQVDTSWIAVILSFVLIAYFQGRFSLVLPATAVDHRWDFRESWSRTRGSGMIIAMALVIPAMIMIPVEHILYGTDVEFLVPIADVVWVLVLVPVYVVEIAIISLAYAKLANQAG